jgi:hypothetical protein
MKARITYPKSFGKVSSTILIGLLFFVVLVLVGCGGGGGGESVEQLPSEQNVTISGKVDDGTASSPITNAICRFVDADNNEIAIVVSDTNGEYSIVVPPELDGFIRCSPFDLSDLTIYTFSSTKGASSGSIISSENVTPTTTIVADIIRNENPAFPLSRKRELLSLIETMQDPELSLVAKASSALYSEMYHQGINARFSGGDGGDGGGNGNGDGSGAAGGSGDGLGASGAAGEGAVASPIPNARCEFMVGNTLKEAQPLRNSVLADFFHHGKVFRHDLKAVTDLVNSILAGHSAEEIKAAFAKYFSKGIGRPFFDIADENGNYFIPVPPNLPGFIQCTPLNYENLILATYVPERQVNEELTGQDVNPATTIFSSRINLELDADLETAKENYLNDIAGLRVSLVPENGILTGEPSGQPADEDVGLVAFTAISMYNTCFQNGINCDYLAGLRSLTEKKDINQVSVPGLPAENTSVLISSVNKIEKNLSIPATLYFPSKPTLAIALSKTRVKVIVSETPGGTIINSANVELTLPANVQCTPSIPSDGCTGTTQNNLPLEFTLTGVDAQSATDFSVEISGIPGFQAFTVNTSVLAATNVEFEIALKFPIQVQLSGSGAGAVDSSPVGISCSSSGDSKGCRADFVRDSQVVLNATPSAGSLFSGWTGGGCSGTNPCAVNMNEAHTVTAMFNKIWIVIPGDPVLPPKTPLYQSLEVQLSGNGTGTVASSPFGIGCSNTGGSTTCKANFKTNTQVILAAEPGIGSFSGGWTGGGCENSKGNTCTVTMDQAHTVTATFNRIVAKLPIKLPLLPVVPVLPPIKP